MKPDKLRALAAALETPGDLTEEELRHAHEDIVEVLLNLAGSVEDAEEEEWEEERTFVFTVFLTGRGTTEDEAWEDAIICFENNPDATYDSAREEDALD